MWQASTKGSFATMSNIKLEYCYRDYGNYKNFNEVVFANPNALTIEEITTAITVKLMDGEYFYASYWGLQDLHFEKWDDELDHAFHAFVGVTLADEPPTDERMIVEFIAAGKAF